MVVSQMILWDGYNCMNIDEDQVIQDVSSCEVVWCCTTSSSFILLRSCLFFVSWFALMLLELKDKHGAVHMMLTFCLVRSCFGLWLRDCCYGAAVLLSATLVFVLVSLCLQHGLCYACRPSESITRSAAPLSSQTLRHGLMDGGLQRWRVMMMIYDLLWWYVALEQRLHWEGWPVEPRSYGERGCLQSKGRWVVSQLYPIVFLSPCTMW